MRLPMLPERLRAQVGRDEAAAEALAAAGQVATGFLLLARCLRGTRKAEEPEGAELGQSYQAALDAYAVRHGLKSSGPGPSVWRITLPDNDPGNY